MNPNMNMHAMPQQQMGGVGNIAGAVGPPNPMMQQGVSPLMQSSPQQPPVGQQQMVPQQQQMAGQMPQNPQGQQQQAQQHPPQPEKIDNISKVKSLVMPMRESLLLTFRGAAFTLQQNNMADNLKRDAVMNSARFDKHLEEFYAYCDQIELHLKTAMQCMQQLSSAQHYLPGAVTALRTEPYMQDNPAGPMPYPTFLNTVRVHIQSTKDLRDTLISASQNISQAD
ncbi:mediator complex subunit intersex [Cochliomyia hominivorax]